MFMLVLLAWVLAGSSALAQTAGEARDLALVALRLEFERDGLAATDADLDARFKTACDKGYNPACRRSTWLVNGEPDPAAVVEVFQPSCEAGDEVACLVMAWSLDADRRRRAHHRRAGPHLAEGRPSAEVRLRRGLQPACHEYAGYLYENKGIVVRPGARPSAAGRPPATGASGRAAPSSRELYKDGGAGVTQSTADRPEVRGPGLYRRVCRRLRDARRDGGRELEPRAARLVLRRAVRPGAPGELLAPVAGLLRRDPPGAHARAPPGPVRARV